MQSHTVVTVASAAAAVAVGGKRALGGSCGRFWRGGYSGNVLTLIDQEKPNDIWYGTLQCKLVAVCARDRGQGERRRLLVSQKPRMVVGSKQHKGDEGSSLALALNIRLEIAEPYINTTIVLPTMGFK